MANSYFQFKQFRIEQGKSTMKVCTDSCIFGAYIGIEESKRVLDIGTGTGLLSLMVAQRSLAVIDAVEIEKDAYHQAKENIERSTWSNRISIHHCSIQEYTNNTTSKFDTIISNPPFFSNQLKSPEKNKNIAHHSEALSFGDLAKCVKDLLIPDGSFHLLLPEFEFNQFIEIAKNYDLYPETKLYIRDKKESPIFRIIGKFTFIEKGVETDSMFIKNSDQQYSERFRELLKDYYLNL